MHARVVAVQAQPSRLEEVICFLEKCVISAGEQQSGLEGLLLLSNEKAGKAISITLWREKSAMGAIDTDCLAQLPRDLRMSLGSPPVVDVYDVRLRTETVPAHPALQFSETSLGIRTENPCDEKLQMSSDRWEPSKSLR